LLRLRENEGAPYLSDGEFVARYLPRFPAWAERPGEVDDEGLLVVAKGLGLADEIEVTRDYGRVLAAHRAGCSVLVRTLRAPRQAAAEAAPHEYTALLVTMDETHFRIWCPFVSGHSDLLPEAGRVWWEAWGSSGLVLRRRRASRPLAAVASPEKIPV
jgi:hypothetical protein